MKSFKSSRWHTTTWSHSAVAAGARPARCLFLCSRLFVSVSSSSLTPEQKDTHSWHEALSLLTPSYCELLVVFSQTLDWTLGKEKTHKWIDIIKRDARRSFERSVGFLTTSVSYRQKKKKPWHAAFTDICIHFSQLYEATKKKKKKKNEQHVLDSSSCVTSVPTLSRLYWTWRYFTTLVS